MTITKLFIFTFVSISLLSFNGCLIFNKISYDVKLDGTKRGVVTIKAYDLRSNAKNEKDFQQDKRNLFSYMLKSKEFLIDAKKNQGKDIIYRNLENNNDTLIGTAKYKFNDISKVEGIEYQDGFYFLTLTPTDSVISTNGEIVKSGSYKRIMWDKSFKNLEFTMFSYSFDENPQRPLAEFYKN